MTGAPENPRGPSDLYLSEQRFQAIYDSVNDGILIQDVDTGATLIEKNNVDAFLKAQTASDGI